MDASEGWWLMSFDWSPLQSSALDKVASWHKSGNEQVMRVFGYAGTGKTTLANHFASEIDGETSYAAYTGKAAMVMRQNDCKDASTIHSLIYKAKRDPQTGKMKFIKNSKGPASKASLIVIDECSMVDEKIAKDLLKFKKPILVLGDPAQLPPVRGGGFFTSVEPEVMLTEIHRQAENNPIIKLATMVREGMRPELGTYGSSKVISSNDVNSKMITDADQVLVGTNKKRHSYNTRMRELYGRTGMAPERGDTLVCLRNNKRTGLFNGGLFEVTSVPDRDAVDRADKIIRVQVQSKDYEDHPLSVDVREEFFFGGAERLHWTEKRETDEFNYGYALTVHKSQGSQWDNVVLFDESSVFRDDWQRWLYTGITRAAKSITVVI